MRIYTGVTEEITGEYLTNVDFDLEDNEDNFGQGISSVNTTWDGRQVILDNGSIDT